MRLIEMTICLLLGLAALDATAPQAAADWRFQRSYFSHRMPPDYYTYVDLPRSRSAYRPAYPNPLPGFSAQGGFRFNRIQINSGTSSDTTIIHEGWLQWRP
jgi:hypothetical protein